MTPVSIVTFEREDPYDPGRRLTLAVGRLAVVVLVKCRLGEAANTGTVDPPIPGRPRAISPRRAENTDTLEDA